LDEIGFYKFVENSGMSSFGVVVFEVILVIDVHDKVMLKMGSLNKPIG